MCSHRSRPPVRPAGAPPGLPGRKDFPASTVCVRPSAPKWQEHTTDKRKTANNDRGPRNTRNTRKGRSPGLRIHGRLLPEFKAVVCRVFRVFRGPMPSLSVRQGRVDPAFPPRAIPPGKRRTGNGRLQSAQMAPFCQPLAAPLIATSTARALLQTPQHPHLRAGHPAPRSPESPPGCHVDAPHPSGISPEYGPAVPEAL